MNAVRARAMVERGGGERPADSKGPSFAPKSVSLSGWDFLNIMLPYFWPEKVLDRFRAVACYLCLGASKACNLTAPIFIASTVDALSPSFFGEPIVFPWEDIVIFIALRFGATLLVEIQVSWQRCGLDAGPSRSPREGAARGCVAREAVPLRSSHVPSPRGPLPPLCARRRVCRATSTSE